MDKAELFAVGGDSGPAVVPGKPDESLLIERISLAHDDDDVMPPKEPFLSAAQIDTLKKWVAGGAPFPKEVTLVAREGSENTRPKAASAGAAKHLASLDVYPGAVNLDNGNDFQKLVVVATYDDETTVDVTANAKYEVAQADLVKRELNKFTPLKDGETTLTVSLPASSGGGGSGSSVTLALNVKGAGAPRPVSFRNDVMPIFMRAGCNTGECHGSARGQDGFMLSLFGYDPNGDHYRLTREMSGRRINLALPGQSMLITKTTEAVPHTGGKKLEPDSEFVKILTDWVSRGAQNDPEDIAHPVSVELYPKKLLLEGEGVTQQMSAVATYSDGTDRDVTDLAVFITSNEISAAVTPEGLITAGQRGEAFVMARFETHTVGSQIIVIPEKLKYTRADVPEVNYVDELVQQKLHMLRITPSDLCSDGAFLRRVYIDVIGQLPSREDYEKFLADKAPDKRARVIDALLERPEFTDMWVMKWAELLTIRSDNNVNRGISYKAALLYHDWLKERIGANVPIDQIVRELLTANGDTLRNPPTNYYHVEQNTLKTAENAAQVFMGMRLQCAQCHNHPFDRWTMNDYYSFAAFFSQVGRKAGRDPRAKVIYDRRSGEAAHPVTKKGLPPKFLGGDAPDTKGKDRRVVLAEWLASPENPYFARNLANIVWAHFLGIGIIEPVDDVRVSNPPSNPELLDALSTKFTEYNYDFRRLVKDICNSRTYQLSTRTNATNETDLTNFSHGRIRRVRAEVLLDSISQVTETQNKFRGLPLGAHATQIADGNTTTYFLTTFGRARRDTVCSCEVAMDPNLSQALHLLNGDTVNEKITEGGIIEKSLKDGKKPPEIIEDLYIRAFSRKPEPEEMKKVIASLNATPEQEQQVLEDVFWALLNSKEYIFNH